MRIISIAFSFLLILAGSSCNTTRNSMQGREKTSSGTRLSEKDRLTFDNIFFSANKELMLGNNEEAANLFTLCLKYDPGNAASLYELAKIYYTGGNKEKALELSGQAADLDIGNTWYQQLYAECLVSQKQYQRAAEIYARILKVYPDKIDTYFEQAEAFIYANKPQEALKVYDQIENKIGVNEEGSIQKMKIYAQQKNTEKAIKELNKLIQANPREPKYYGMLGEIYENSGQKEKALQAYNDLIRIDPNNPFVHLSLAQYYFGQKKDEQGLEEYKLAFGNSGLDIDTKIKILNAYFELSEKKPAVKDDAIQLCKILIDTHPDEARAYSMYGKFLFRDKNLKEARDEFRMANARDKTRYDIWYYILLIDSEMNDFENMFYDSKQTIDLFPALPLGYLFNGIACNQKKDYNSALTVLKEGKEYVVGNSAGDSSILAQFYATLGDVNHQLKNTQASDSSYEKALEIDPKNSYVLNNYAYYLSLRKEKLDHAEAMSKKTVTMDPGNNSFLDTYGWILYQLGKYEDAKKWIGKALENGAMNNGVILEHFGDVLFRLGEIDKALEYWNNAKKSGGASDLLEKKITDKKLYE